MTTISWEMARELQRQQEAEKAAQEGVEIVYGPAAPTGIPTGVVPTFPEPIFSPGENFAMNAALAIGAAVLAVLVMRGVRAS